MGAGSHRVRLDLGVGMGLGLGTVSLRSLGHGQHGGWCWVPGTLWGPAWVAWRAGRVNVGWAPLPPRGIKPWTPYRHPIPLALRPRRQPRHSGHRAGAAEKIPGVFGRTAAVSTARSLSIGRLTVRFNAGPNRIQVLRRSYSSSPPVRRAGATRGAPPGHQASDGSTPTLASVGCRGGPRTDADPPLA